MSVPPITVVALGAVSISFAPILVKHAYTYDVGPAAVAAWRCWMGSILLFVFARLRRAPLLPPRRVLIASAFAGLIFATDLYVWHQSILLVGAGMATILGNTQVFWTPALRRIVFNEPIPTRLLLAAALAFAGVGLLAGVGAGLTFTPQYLTGVFLALATGLAYAGYIIALQRTNEIWSQIRTDTRNREQDPLSRAAVVLAWLTLVGGTALGLGTLGDGHEILLPSWEAVGTIFVLALVAQVVGWLLISTGLREVAAAQAALVLLLQPALAAVWGAWFFGEAMQPSQIAGASLTLFAVYLGTRITSR